MHSGSAVVPELDRCTVGLGVVVEHDYLRSVIKSEVLRIIREFLFLIEYGQNWDDGIYVTLHPMHCGAVIGSLRGVRSQVPGLEGQSSLDPMALHCAPALPRLTFIGRVTYCQQ